MVINVKPTFSDISAPLLESPSGQTEEQKERKDKSLINNSFKGKFWQHLTHLFKLNSDSWKHTQEI